MTTFKNQQLTFDLPKILEYDKPVNLFADYDSNLITPYILTVQDNSYFYINQKDRDDDFVLLKLVVPMETLFKIVMEIEVPAENPLEAAKTLEKWIKENDSNFQYYVQDPDTQKIVSVDLQEEDEDAVLPVEYYHPLIEDTNMPELKKNFNSKKYYIFGDCLIHSMSIDEMIEHHKGNIKVFEFIEGITDPTVLLNQFDNNEDWDFNVYSKEIREEEYNKLLDYLK